MATASAPATTQTLLSHPRRPTHSRWPQLLRVWFPVFCFAILLAVESTAAFGADRTSAPLHSAFRALAGGGMDANWSAIHHLLRKTGHFTGYGIFSLLWFRAFRTTFRVSFAVPLGGASVAWISQAMAVAATFLAGTADELHQTFVPNRTGCLADVLVDTLGAVAFQAALCLALGFAAWRKARGEESDAVSGAQGRPLAA